MGPLLAEKLNFTSSYTHGFLSKAKGHRQIMDFYLVQTAASHGAKLATLDGGTLAAWPGITVAID